MPELDGRGQLEGKVAVVTGATAGIGLAIARRFVAEGAHVFITGRGQPALDAAVGEIGRNVTGVRGDASMVADLDRLYAAVGEFGRGIDVLVANAGGGGGSARMEEVTAERFAASTGLTFRGTYFTIQRALPQLNDAQGFARFAGPRGEEFRTHLAGVIPVGRIGRPEEVASAAMFLASAESSFVADAELVVDGGMSQI